MTNRQRFAIVTGAASGIGFATAERLARDGYAVGLVDVDEGGLQKASSAVGTTGSDALVACLDLTEPGAFAGAVEQMLEEQPGIDVLVNVAGIGVAATILETSDEDWNNTLAVNLTAMFHTCRAVLPHMLAAGSGAIVNVSSVAGLVGVGRRAAYCASKAGVLGLTRALAVDHAKDGIRVNAVCPGTVATEWIDKILANAPDPAATRRAMEQRQLDGRMGTPEEVAASIAFLVSDEARFFNGASVVMDGGMTAI
jgi:NAD(P)-dependent dehydrogenase (short-subunit alcohol dehydrogenase family)